jgi:hypothetical protein
VDFEGAIRQLQNTLIVMTAIEEHQAKAQRIQAAELDALRRMLIEGQKLHEKAMRNFDERMIEIDRKLKRLLGRLPPE